MFIFFGLLLLISVKLYFPDIFSFFNISQNINNPELALLESTLSNKDILKYIPEQIFPNVEKIETINRLDALYYDINKTGDKIESASNGDSKEKNEKEQNEKEQTNKKPTSFFLSKKQEIDMDSPYEPEEVANKFSNSSNDLTGMNSSELHTLPSQNSHILDRSSFRFRTFRVTRLTEVFSSNSRYSKVISDLNPDDVIEVSYAGEKWLEIISQDGTKGYVLKENTFEIKPN